MRGLGMALVVGLGALAFSGGSAKAVTPKPPGPNPNPNPAPEIPREIGVRMATALATGNPTLIRAEAAKLRAEGYYLQAGDLERAAALIEASQQPVEPVGPTGPPEPEPVIVYPTQPAHVPPSLRGVTLRLDPLQRFDARVGLWQTRLVEIGVRPASSGIDSRFGPNTEKQTKAAQTTLKLTPANGIADPKTIGAAYAWSGAVVPAPAPSPAPTPTPAPPPAPIPYPAEPAHVPPSLRGVTLKRTAAEAFDARVGLWQTRLVALGVRPATATTDSRFGANTEAQTKAAQTKLKLTATGIADPKTISVAYAWSGAVVPAPGPAPAPAPAPIATYPAQPAHVPPSLRGVTLKRTAAETFDERVGLWQNRLVVLGVRPATATTDSRFGANTEAQTKAAQTKLKLTPANGIADPATISAAYAWTQSAPTPIRPAVTVPVAPIVAPSGAVPMSLVFVTLRKVPDSEPADPRTVVWQDRLKALAFRPNVKSDGKFGTNTELQTKALQKARGLTQTGVADPTTIAAAYNAPTPVAKAAPVAAPSVAAALPALAINPSTWRAVMKRGNEGPDVTQWQMVLLRDGYKPTVDGVFGGEVETMTRAWQSEHGLTPDGKVGNDVKAVLASQKKTSSAVAGELAGVTTLERTTLPPSFFLAEEPPTSAAHSLALALSEHLAGARAGGEDRELVSRFQRSVGLNDTGAYGPATAEAFISFGLVPPRPFYWPSKKVYRAQSRYKLALREQARRDPARATEWLSASNV